MPRPPPPWFDQAAAMLANGATKADVARALNLRRETISRAFAKKLKAEVERRTAAAAAPAEAPALVEKAQQVLRDHLDSEDPRAQLDAAKTIIGKLAPQLPPDPQPDGEEEARPEAAVRELIASLPTLGAVLAEGGVSPELVQELRRALDAARADLEPALAAVN